LRAVATVVVRPHELRHCVPAKSTRSDARLTAWHQARRHRVLERPRGHDRQVGIHRCDQRPDLSGDASIPERTSDDRRVPLELLLQRHVHERTRKPVEETTGSDVAHDADASRVRFAFVRPCGPPIGCCRYFADAGVARPELPRGRFAHNGHELCAVAVAGIEVSSCSHRNPQRCEVSGFDDVPIHDEKSLSGRWCDARNGQHSAHALETARELRRDGRGLYMGQRADAVDEFVDEAWSRRVV
jgi:hypothetical protein